MLVNGLGPYNTFPFPHRPHRRVQTLLTKSIGKEPYKLYGSNGRTSEGNNLYSVSSDRKRLLKKIKSLQTLFSNKWDEYELEKLKDPESERCQELYSECCRIHEKSDELINLL